MEIVSIGEALIDFTPGTEERSYLMHFGGAPANLAIVSARMGARVAFVGKVGDDQFGRFLQQTFLQEGVSGEGISFAQNASTTLAFVHLDGTGERSFSFVRNPGADMLLEVEDLPKLLLQSAKVFHFGSALLADNPGYSAVKEAVRLVKESGAVVSFDPNYRASLWNDAEVAKKVIMEMLSQTDLLKVSEEEATFLTGKTDMTAAVRDLAQRGPRIVVVTCGSAGCFYRADNNDGMVEGFPVVAVDTTGAGDTFWGTFLARFVRFRLTAFQKGEVPRDNLVSDLRFANAAGAMSVICKGAIEQPITTAQVEAWIARITAGNTED